MANEKQIENLELSSIVKVYDKIPYADAMNEMIASDGLLLFDTILETESLQPYLPSKSLEYILLKKPLFILAEHNSPTYRIFTSLNYTCTTYDVASIKKNFEALLKRNHQDLTYDITKFENENCVKELVDYVA